MFLAKRNKKLEEQFEVLTSFIEQRSKELNALNGEIEAKTEQLAEIETRLKSYLELAQIREEIAVLEERRASLSKYYSKKFDPSKIIFALYTVDDNDDELLGSFIYMGDAIETYDDESYLCNEYKSIGGHRWAAIDSDNDVVESSNKRMYNAYISEYITLEELCRALSNTLYCEDFITVAEIDKLIDILQTYLEDNDSLMECLDAIRSDNWEKRRNKKGI